MENRLILKFLLLREVGTNQRLRVVLKNKDVLLLQRRGATLDLQIFPVRQIENRPTSMRRIFKVENNVNAYEVVNENYASYEVDSENPVSLMKGVELEIDVGSSALEVLFFGI